MSNIKLARYIKSKNGTKTELATTSLNLERRQLDFIRSRDLNLSLMIRDYIDELIKSEGDLL